MDSFVAVETKGDWLGDGKRFLCAGSLNRVGPRK